MSTDELLIGSAFSGYGGLERAVQEVLGGRVAWHIENDPAASKVLAHHNPGVPNLGDITTVDWATVLPVAILAAGFPCQDISNAGQRAGIEGARSGLWSHVVDAIRILRPRLVYLENVSAIVVRGLGRVVTDLASIGYDIRWMCLRASDVGAPHRRDRWFAIAWPASNSAGDGRDERRSEAAGQLGGLDAAFGGATASAHAHGLGPVRSGSARGRWSGPEDHGQPAADAEGERYGDTGTAGVGGVPAAAVAGGERVAVSDSAGEGWREPRGVGSGQAQGAESEAEPDVGRSGGVPAPDASGIKVGEQPVPVGGRDRPAVAGLDHTPAADADGARQQQREGHEPDLAGRPDHGPEAADWGQFEPAIHRWEAVIGRPAPEPTIPGRRDNRVLNPAFVEFLMGLPEGHVTAVPGLSRNDMLRLLGNGVVIRQAAAALRSLLGSAHELREAS